MRKIITVLLGAFFFVSVYSQIHDDFECNTENWHECFDSLGGINALNIGSSVFKSSNGTGLPTAGTIRALTIFVNIIYDQHPAGDPRPWSNPAWLVPPVTASSSINDTIYKPNYMLNLFDTIASPTNNHVGIMTRMYAEASFNQFILLSDFMVVNIRQSVITPNTQGHSATAEQVRSAVIDYINNNGGLVSYFDRNNQKSISDYDKITRQSNFGQEIVFFPDGRLDLVNFIIRNPTNAYGGLGIATGTASYSSTLQIRIGNSIYPLTNVTYQGIGHEDVTLFGRNILTHELAHFLLGGNEAHTLGGGNHSTRTFIGAQPGGYGLWAGMTSANAYDRWRLGWVHPSNHPHRIGANGAQSDISQADGTKTFQLRDFVTYGDAIRIKLPYKDSNATSDQYIWLANHQKTKNGKMDFLLYSTLSCRAVNTDGIIAFHQVGRNILEHTDRGLVFPVNEADNLKMISAEGNYNMAFTGNFIEDCLGFCGNNCRPVFECGTSNPLQGINDQTSAFSNASGNLLRHVVGAKIKNGVLQNNLPWLGDQYDAFVPNPEIRMDISTNPSPVNVLTYYNNQNFVPIITNRNTRRIYLTGLSIRMIDPTPNYSSMKTYTVEVRWDDYDVKQCVNWTGDIVLKEQLNLKTNKTIYLEQNLTPNQTTINTVSGFFAPPTKFTCESGSKMNLEPNSKVILKDKSSFILENNAELNIQDGAEIIVEAGSTFIVESGAKLNIQGSGRLIIQQGAYICVKQGANIHLQDYISTVLVYPNAIYGANPALFNINTCRTSILFVGNGCITNCHQDIFILQNETISSNRHITARKIFAGRNITTAKSQGDVIINNNAVLILEAEEVILDAGVDVQSGADLQIW